MPKKEEIRKMAKELIEMVKSYDSSVETFRSCECEHCGEEVEVETWLDKDPNYAHIEDFAKLLEVEIKMQELYYE